MTRSLYSALSPLIPQRHAQSATVAGAAECCSSYALPPPPCAPWAPRDAAPWGGA